MDSTQTPQGEDHDHTRDNGLAQRLRQARKQLGYTQQNMGRAIGGTLRAWQEYEAGRRRPRQEALAGLARMGVNVNWVLVGEGPMWSTELGGATHEVVPPVLSQRSSGGRGHGSTNAPIGFDPEWLRGRFGMVPEQAAVLTVRGDALSPSLQAGDVVLIDRNIQQVREEGFYAVDAAGVLGVRRARITPEGRIELIADEAGIDTLTVSGNGDTGIRILGRAAALLRRV